MFLSLSDLRSTDVFLFPARRAYRWNLIQVVSTQEKSNFRKVKKDAFVAQANDGAQNNVKRNKLGSCLLVALKENWANFLPKLKTSSTQVIWES